MSIFRHYKRISSGYSGLVLFVSHDVLIECRGAMNHWRQIRGKPMDPFDDQTSSLMTIRTAVHLVEIAAGFLSA